MRSTGCAAARRPSTAATASESAARRRRPPARKAQKTVVVGINFGSSAISAAFTVDNGAPEKVSMGMVHGRGGRLEHVYKLPTWVKFTGPNQFQTLGHQPVTDYMTTSSGPKQSLDHRLCKPSSEGAFFLDLCKKYSVSNEDVVRKLFEDARPLIEEAIKKRLELEVLSRSDWSVNVGIPTSWSDGSVTSNKIQKVLYKCLIDAHYPKEIRFDIESGLTQAYLLHKRGKTPERMRDAEGLEIFFDMGATTGDLICRKQSDKYTVLAASPEGCGGGMADFWRFLQTQCHDKDPSLTFFEAARDYVHGLSEDTVDDFRRDKHVISATELKDKIRACFAEPIAKLQNMIEKMSPVSRIAAVVVSGEAPTSNAFIEKLWKTAIDDALAGTRWPNCLVTFVEPEDASIAVCMGAAIPYEEDPRHQFKKWCFGFKCRLRCPQRDRCLEPSTCQHGKNYIQEVKARGSTKMKGWESVSTDDLEAGTLTIEPHMVVAGKPWKKQSRDTRHQAWPATNAVPMNPVVVDLHACAELGSMLWVRFRVDEQTQIEPGADFNPDDPPQLIFEVSVSDGKDKKIISSVVLGLYADRDRLFFLEQGAGSNSDEHGDKSRNLNARSKRDVEGDGQEEENKHHAGEENGERTTMPGDGPVQEIGETPPPTRRAIETQATTAGQKRHERDDQSDEDPAPKRQRRDASADLGSQPAEASMATLPLGNEESASLHPAQTESASGGELSNIERAEGAAGSSRASSSTRSSSTRGQFYDVVEGRRPE